MNNPNPTPNATPPQDKKGTLVTGAILIIVGLGLLISQFLDLGGVFFLLFGLGMLAAGCLTRENGWIIPGGIVSGIGLGIVTMENFLPAGFNEDAEGGVFLLCFASGWLTIVLCSRIFTNDTQVWALFPGGIMAVIGTLVLAGEQGERLLELIGQFWPVGLIVVGVAILVGWLRSGKNHS